MKNRHAVILTAVVVGATIFVIRYWVINFRGFLDAGDFGVTLTMTRNVLAGREAYTGLARMAPYPLTAVLFGWPFVLLPDRLAGTLFISIVSAILAGTVAAKDKPWRWLLFLSLPFAHALEWAQYSPMITLGWYIPVLAPLMVVLKPQIALPIALQRLSRRGIVIAVIVFAATFVIEPLWPLHFSELLDAYQMFIVPLLAPGGFLLALALLKAHDERARLLFAMAVLPARGAYDLVPLFLIPATAGQMLVLVVTTWLAPFNIWYLAALLFLFISPEQEAQDIHALIAMVASWTKQLFAPNPPQQP